MGNEVISAAKRERIGVWRWTQGTSQLVIDADMNSLIRDLGGSWSLEAFGLQLDGLSRSRLMRTFGQGAGEVSCALGLSDGRRVQMVGAFDAEGSAEGILIQSETVGQSAVKPGPLLTPVFQPIISLHTGQAAGFEALARWNGTEEQDDGNFEDPALATNMLIQSAEALAIWHRATGRKDLFVHVNLTARDLASGNIADLVETLRSGYNLPEGLLKVELTEQAALRDADLALSAIKEIKAAGAGLVLDDFGSGHSSFAWLADMPADALKIDPDLTRRLGDARTEHILEAVTLLASRLGMEVTAEGVENKADVSKLRQLGFTYVQGFAFARPMEDVEALEFLKGESIGDV